MTEILLKEEELQAMITLKIIQAHARAEAKERTGNKMSPSGAELCQMRMTISEVKVQDGPLIGQKRFKFSFGPKIVT